MGKQSHGKLIAYLPLVLVATFAVVIAPMLLVSWLRESGVVTSVWAAMAAGVALSLLVSQGGAAVWKRGGSAILFSELMLWGWVRRWRSERRLTAAADLLGLTAGRPKAISGGNLTNGQKSSLLWQLTSSLEARDQYTHGHSRRVARHAANIAKQMGLNGNEVAKIRAAGAMHDVGKVETPIAVLHKEGKLNDEEYAIVKRHPVDGAKMVATLDDDELTAIVRHHHERLDGTGYPDGLAGEEIPLGARILAVADTFDAITSTRPYRHAHAHKKALDILVAEAGTQLDPDAVRAFRSCYSGRRPLAYWTILVNGRPRLASMFGGGLSPGNAASVVATTATAAVVGAAAVAPLAVPSPSPSPEPSPRVAAVGAQPPASAARSASRDRIARTTAMAAVSPERRAKHAVKAGNDKRTTVASGHGDARAARTDATAPLAAGAPPRPSSMDGTAISQPANWTPNFAEVVQEKAASGKDKSKGRETDEDKSTGKTKDKKSKDRESGEPKGNAKGGGPGSGKGLGQSKGKDDSGGSPGQDKANGQDKDKGKDKDKGHGGEQGQGQGEVDYVDPVKDVGKDDAKHDGSGGSKRSGPQ